MSIWCSHEDVGHDVTPWANESDRANEPRGGEVRSYAEGFSNHHPTTEGDHETPAAVGISSIAPWCVPGHDQDGERYHCSGCGEYHDHPQCGEWVRLDVDAPHALSWWTKNGENPVAAPIHATVVLDEAAARQLAADLLEWADRPKVRPL